MNNQEQWISVREIQRANLRLMAAAPRLLAALERLLDSQRGLNMQEWQEAVAEGRAAVAAARGEEQE